MKSNIFIPEKINVGFQNRSDTYTKKLAYIIYYDQKGVLRKETSWNSWRDDKIENVIAKNVPTSGFVLNKKAGGYDTGWNHRQTYCRVYDPRGFEFEITIPNLLYILENTTSTKGKGLEGDFVYGWDGKDLILIPTDSPDYKELIEFNKLIYSKNYIKTKDLIIGATYLTNKNEEIIYMGRFDSYGYYGENEGLRFWFCKQDKDISFIEHKSIGGKLISCIDDRCVSNYSEIFDKLECNSYYSPYDVSKDTFELRSLEDFELQYKDENSYWQYRIFYGNINGQYEKFEVKKYSRLNDTELKNKNGFYVRPKNQNDYTYEGDYWRSNRKSIFVEPLFSGTIEEISNNFKPSLKCQYLKNNKLYRKDKS